MIPAHRLQHPPQPHLYITFVNHSYRMSTSTKLVKRVKKCTMTPLDPAEGPSNTTTVAEVHQDATPRTDPARYIVIELPDEVAELLYESDPPAHSTEYETSTKPRRLR